MTIIKEIYVEVKKSFNFNTWTTGETLTIEDTEKVEEERKTAWVRCNANVEMQIEEYKKCQSKGQEKKKDLLGEVQNEPKGDMKC